VRENLWETKRQVPAEALEEYCFTNLTLATA